MSGIGIETSCFERDTRDEIRRAIRRTGPAIPAERITIIASMFDGTAEILHDVDDALPADFAAKVAERLRGGPMDPAAPSQWHVVAERPMTGVVGNTPDAVIGTRVSFGRTFPVPPSYDEEARSWAA